MFEKDIIAIDLDATNIKIMVGNKKVVKHFETIKTPEDCIIDDKIVNLAKIKNSLQVYLNKNNIKAKDVAFTIHGQDVVSRHTEVPIMDEEGIKAALDFEMNQYLPKNSEEYIIDYEITGKIDTVEKKVLKLFVAAVPKEKVNQIVKLTERLKLKVTAVDISSNCACRVFKEISKKHASMENIAVIDFGSDDTNIIILDKGKLFIEREIPFGINNILREIIKREDMELNDAFNYLQDNINLIGAQEGDELEKRILNLFDSVFSSLQKIVTFFTIGKSKDNLDGIYIIGSANMIRGLKEYTNTYFNCPVFLLDNAESIGVKTVIPTDCNITQYIGTLGLLLRKE